VTDRSPCNRFRVSAAIEPGVPVLGFGGLLEALSDVGVSGKPGFPVVGGGGGDRLNTAMTGGTGGPALGHAIATDTLVAEAFVNFELGAIGLNRPRWAGWNTALATDAIRGDGVSHDE